MEQNMPIQAGMHLLPPLPYHYNALEPIISDKTLRIHHTIHHKKYVDNLNTAELAIADARSRADYKYLKHWESELAFNGSGHVLHSIYWTVMAPPDMGGKPGQYTKSYIDWYFGSVDTFKAQFTEAANSVEGSGWCILGYNPAFFRLELLQCTKHQNLTQWGIIPILVCDVWEHAYYLDYQASRAEYINGWWSLVNWSVVESRFMKAAPAVMPLSIIR